MQQINVIVTPKVKQTISVTVNGVAMSVVNSDGSYSTTHYSGTPFIIPDTIIKNTAGTTILTQPSATSTGVIADSVVTNSNNRFSLNVPAETNPVLADIIHIDSDGTTVVLPAMTAMVCTQSVGADVENSDESYTQHVNNGATLVLPDTIIKNTAGATILTQPSATNTGVIADSVISNSDDSFVANVPAEEPLELADITVYSKDANGQTIATPYPSMKDYTEVGSIPDANGWIRPPDWLPISHLVTDGEEKAVALYAVWDAAWIANGYNNYCALLCRGAYTVDWGDGTVDNVADNVQAEHTYVYANLPASSYCSRGYRQAIITITPQAGQHLTLINFSLKHTLNTVNTCTNNFLDVQISGTDIAQIKMYGSSYSRCNILERFYCYQLTTALTTTIDMFRECVSIMSINISGLNLSSVHNFSRTFYNNYSIKTLNLSAHSFINANNTISMISSLKSLDKLYINSFMSTILNTTAYMFYDLNSLLVIDLVNIDMSSVVSASSMFMMDVSLQKIDLSHTTLASVTDNTRIINSTSSLAVCRLPQIGRTFTVANNLLDTANLDLLLTDLRNLNGSISTSTRTTGNYGTGYAVGDLIQINGGNNDARIKVLTLSGSAVATYQLMVAGTGYTVAGALTTTAITGAGTGLKIDVTALVATQRITVTGNPGATTCNPAIATAKNWIVVT